MKIIKQCEYCHKEYEAVRKDQKFCKNDHYTQCEACNKTILIKNIKRPDRSCSTECAKILNKRRKNPLSLKKCEYPGCNEKFKPFNSKSKICNKEHSLRCVICDKTFIVKDKFTYKNPPKTCSKICASQIINFKERNAKSKITNLKKYGVENVSQAQEIKDKKSQTTLKKYGVINIFNLPEIKIKASKNNGYTISRLNKEWHNKLKKETGVDFSYEVNFGKGKKYSADLGYGNILIDINPSFTHNNSVGFAHATGRCKIVDCDKKSHMPKDKNYHQLRALEAIKDGKVLLQYFDWFDEEIFISIVKSKLKKCENRIGARKTELRVIKQSVANKFFRDNHLQGASNSQTVCLGLFYDGELVHCQSYGKSRLRSNVEWEAIRSCSKLNWQIMGAFTKCDKYFFKNYKPNSFVSYVDLSYSDGSTESAFYDFDKVITNTPNAMWVNMFNINDKRDFVSDSAVRRISADRVLGFEIGDKYPVNDDNGDKVTNDTVMLSEGFVKVYPAGVKTFIWRNK